MAEIDDEDKPAYASSFTVKDVRVPRTEFITAFDVEIRRVMSEGDLDLSGTSWQEMVIDEVYAYPDACISFAPDVTVQKYDTNASGKANWSVYVEFRHEQVYNRLTNYDVLVRDLMRRKYLSGLSIKCSNAAEYAAVRDVVKSNPEYAKGTALHGNERKHYLLIVALKPVITCDALHWPVNEVATL
jgi:hypothetical protein